MTAAHRRMSRAYRHGWATNYRIHLETGDPIQTVRPEPQRLKRMIRERGPLSIPTLLDFYDYEAGFKYYAVRTARYSQQ